MIKKVEYKKQSGKYILNFMSDEGKVKEEIIGYPGYSQQIIDSFASGCEDMEEVVEKILGDLNIPESRKREKEKRKIYVGAKNLEKKGFLDFAFRVPVAPVEKKTKQDLNEEIIKIYESILEIY